MEDITRRPGSLELCAGAAERTSGKGAQRAFRGGTRPSQPAPQTDAITGGPRGSSRGRGRETPERRMQSISCSGVSTGNPACWPWVNNCDDSEIGCGARCCGGRGLAALRASLGHFCSTAARAPRRERRPRHSCRARGERVVVHDFNDSSCRLGGGGRGFESKQDFFPT